MVIRDTDSEKLSDIYGSWNTKFPEILNTKKIGGRPHHFEIVSNNHIKLTKAKHVVNIILLTTPESLEHKICEKYSELNKLNINCNEDKIHKILGKLSKKRGVDEIDIIIETEPHLHEETWLKEIKIRMANCVSNLHP